jgi:hypothetical protein
MKTDVSGCSTCPNGEERYEYFKIKGSKTGRWGVQYDYRTRYGELFSTVAPDLDAARIRRDNWMRQVAK